MWRKGGGGLASPQPPLCKPLRKADFRVCNTLPRFATATSDAMKGTHKLKALSNVADVLASAPSISAAAKTLGVNRSTIHRWLQGGKVGVSKPAIEAKPGERGTPEWRAWRGERSARWRRERGTQNDPRVALMNPKGGQELRLGEGKPLRKVPAYVGDFKSFDSFQKVDGGYLGWLDLLTQSAWRTFGRSTMPS